MDNSDLEFMEARAIKTCAHVRMTNKVLDEAWLEAEKSGSWGRVCDDIKKILAFLGENHQYFPNYEVHADRWNDLLKVAEYRATREC